jgi:hypothetical protein
MSIIKVRRGLAANLPTTGLNPGEFLFATDTGDLYICQTATVKIKLFNAGAIADYMRKDQNLADVPDKASARSNLSVYSKVEVDQLIAGLKWKDPVRVVSVFNITASGLQSIDGIDLAVNDRVLLKYQADSKTNGIYVVKTGAWVRSSDADSAAELLNAAVFVSEGVTYSETAWVCSTDNISLGTSNINFVQFAGSSTYIGGSGVDITGNSVDLNLSELTASSTLNESDYIIFIDSAALGAARNKKILKTDFISQLGMYKVQTQAGGTPGYLNQTVRSSQGINISATSQELWVGLDISGLSVDAAADAAADYVPYYDNSEVTQKRATINDLVKNAIIDGGSF